MPYEHIPPEYHPAALQAAASQMAADVERFAVRRQRAELEQMIERHETDKADCHRRILGALIEHGGGGGPQNKAKVMLEVATSIRPTEQKLLETSARSSAGRAVVIAMGLRYFANHPEVFIAELLDPTPPPLPDPEQGFLNLVLDHHIYTDPKDAGAQSRMRDLPAPLALAYMGITNCWLFAQAAPAEQDDPEKAFKFFMEAAAAWDRLGSRLSRQETASPAPNQRTDWPPPWLDFQA